MKKTIIIFISLTFSLLMQAQPQASWEKTVQFFTPNAETMGKYGQVPVNYFNGLPQISIPLTNFKVNGYDLPISLSYYAGGNKPDSHPGWVGLGWNLSAGGSINRIIKGIKDETTSVEANFTIVSAGTTTSINPGYYYQMDKVNRVNWSDSTYLTSIIGDKLLNSCFYDTEPDEFQVSIGNINASFYFVGNNAIKIKSKSNDNFTVSMNFGTNENYELYNTDRGQLYANCFTYINEIILTNNDGIKYYFGGDMSAIEFSYLGANGVFRGDANKWFTGTANTWQIRKIVLPNGEIIYFNYEKNGTPIIEQNNHYFRNYFIYGTNEIMQKEDSRYPPSNYFNYSYTFIQPSYLNTIESSVSGRIMEFKRSKSTELNYNINTSAFQKKIIDVKNTGDINCQFSDLNDANYYMQLDSIIDNSKNITFKYSSSTDTRLKLQNVSFKNIKSTLINKYSFKYNDTSLPVYNSKKTDNWGYYNGRNYDSEVYKNLLLFRSADTTYMKAEMLTQITYPTGGFSLFDYDPHSFSKVAHQFPFELKDSASTNCGGLRIKKIITVNTDNKAYTREFYYENKTGQSSGILSGLPIYNVNGNQHVNYSYKGWSGGIYIHLRTDYKYGYTLGNQQLLNQLANTNGNHVTYSRVIEKLSDNSKTIYYYTNHEKYPDEAPVNALDNIDSELPINSFMSKEIERGLLDSIEYYKNDAPVKKELYYYNSDPNRYNDFVKSINTFSLYDMARISALKIYTFCPYLKSKKEIVYDDSRNKLTTEIKYKYDDTYRILTNQVVKDSHGDSLTTVYTYPFHIKNNYLAPAPTNNTSYNTRYSISNLFMTCFSMYGLNFLNSPVEITTYKNQKVIDSKLINYGQHGYDFLPDSIYTLETTAPLSDFQRYYKSSNQPNLIDNRYEKYSSISYLYDSKSNVIQLRGKGGIKTVYLWGYNYQYPIGEIKNATLNEVTGALGGTTPDQLAASLVPDMSKVDALRAKLPNAKVSTYTYKPFVGILSAINPQGLTTRYLYDDFNRLAVIKDNNYNIVKTFNYAYKDVGASFPPNTTTTISALITSAQNISYNVSNLATIVATGGSGNFEFDWTLKNPYGEVLVNGINAGATFTYIPTTLGQLTLECIITDLETYKSTLSTKTINCDYLPLVANSINIDGRTDYGMNSNATISATGGSGMYVYSWYLKNATGNVLKSSENSNSPQFNFSCTEIGNLTLECVVKDNLTNNQLTVTKSITCDYPPLSLTVIADDSYHSYDAVNCGPDVCSGTATVNISGGSGNYQIISWKYRLGEEGQIMEEMENTNEFTFYNYWHGSFTIQCDIQDTTTGIYYTAYKNISVN